MTFYGNRQKFDGLSEAIGKAFMRLGLSANAITALSLLPALLSAYMIARSEFLAAALLFIVSAFLDMVDGAVARATGKASRFGAYLDTMVDRYVEFFVVFGILMLALGGGVPGFILPAAAWLFIFYFGAIMTSYSKAAAKEKDFVKSEIRGGLVERAERLLILFAGILLAGIDAVYLTFAIVLLAFLSNVTVIQRALIAIRESGRSVF